MDVQETDSSPLQVRLYNHAKNAYLRGMIEMIDLSKATMLVIYGCLGRKDHYDTVLAFAVKGR